jgi:hypothetical protein
VPAPRNGPASPRISSVNEPSRSGPCPAGTS